MKTLHKMLDIARLGLESLTRHKVRSLLTSLGIIFGVWSVVTMLAINEGASYEAQQALRELGSTNIIIESVKPPQESTASAQTSGILDYGLKKADVDRLRTNIPGVQRCVVAHRTQKHARVGGRSVPVSVFGTEPAYSAVARVDLRAGRFLTTSDYLRSRSVCVITAALARKLLTYEDPLGQTIVLGDEPFTVVGVLSQLPRSLAGGTSDVGNYVLIPMTSDLARFGDTTVMISAGSQVLERVEISQIILQMSDEDAVIDGAAVARSLLGRFHEKVEYEITVPLELIQQKRKQLRLWNFMFLTIASVSMVVGGIGIMNIMLAAVTERTREIGIRRALGAKRRDIVVQFLVEAVTLTTAGGLAGIGLGMFLPWMVGKLLNITTVFSAMMVVLPFVMAVAVGLVSGLYPAFRAARLDPIIALRHE